MSKAKNSLPAGNAEPGSGKPVPDRHSGPVPVLDGNGWGELGMDDVAGSSGHATLSRSSAPQGRRSLFRR
jgi:hypothetical protein